VWTRPGGQQERGTTIGGGHRVAGAGSDVERWAGQGDKVVRTPLVCPEHEARRCGGQWRVGEGDRRARIGTGVGSSLKKPCVAEACAGDNGRCWDSRSQLPRME
jgi:hypothetical protein